MEMEVFDPKLRAGEHLTGGPQGGEVFHKWTLGGCGSGSLHGGSQTELWEEAVLVRG